MLLRLPCNCHPVRKSQLLGSQRQPKSASRYKSGPLVHQRSLAALSEKEED